MSDNADKRSVATDALETLGSIIDENQKRDAIHLAVEPVVAKHVLSPGESVGFYSDGRVGASADPVGIVDPFLKDDVQPGQRFWLVVFPRQITSLRHVWEHPKFRNSRDVQVVEAPVKNQAGGMQEIENILQKADDINRRTVYLISQDWISSYARGLGSDYGEVMARAEDYIESGEYWTEGGRFEGEWVPEEFWVHYETVTGKPVPETERGSFFSCSC